MVDLIFKAESNEQAVSMLLVVLGVSRCVSLGVSSAVCLSCVASVSVAVDGCGRWLRAR